MRGQSGCAGRRAGEKSVPGQKRERIEKRIRRGARGSANERTETGRERSHAGGVHIRARVHVRIPGDGIAMLWKANTWHAGGRDLARADASPRKSRERPRNAHTHAHTRTHTERQEHTCSGSADATDPARFRSIMLSRTIRVAWFIPPLRQPRNGSAPEARRYDVDSTPYATKN